MSMELFIFGYNIFCRSGSWQVCAVAEIISWNGRKTTELSITLAEIVQVWCQIMWSVCVSNFIRHLGAERKQGAPEKSEINSAPPPHTHTDKRVNRLLS